VGVIREFHADAAEVSGRGASFGGEQASERGRAVAGIQGEMVEAVHERMARRILARAESP
jgi:citrate lyase beta subunit